MVVRSGVTPRDVVQKATEMLHSSSPTRLILTDAWSQGAPYYVRHGYSAAVFPHQFRMNEAYLNSSATDHADRQIGLRQTPFKWLGAIKNAF